jgi:uncharacterized Tic20 family protein
MNVDNQKQDRLLAGLSHLGVLLPLAGMLVPLVVWLSRRGEPSVLRFQAIQALIYQGIGAAGYMLYYAVSMAAGVAFVPVSLGLAVFSDAGSSSTPGADGLLFAIFFILIAIMVLLSLAVQCLAWPIYIFLGTWAGVRVLQGRDFHYPVIGGRLAKKFQSASGFGAVSLREEA